MVFLRWLAQGLRRQELSCLERPQSFDNHRLACTLGICCLLQIHVNFPGLYPMVDKPFVYSNQSCGMSLVCHYLIRDNTTLVLSRQGPWPLRKGHKRMPQACINNLAFRFEGCGPMEMRISLMRVAQAFLVHFASGSCK